MTFMNDIYKPVTGIISRDEYQKGTMQVKALTDLENRMYTITLA